MMDTHSTSGLFRHLEHGLIPDPQEHQLAITYTPDGAAALIVSPNSQKVRYALWIPHTHHAGDRLPALSLLLQTLATDHLLPIPSVAILTDQRVLLVPGTGFQTDEIHRFFFMAFPLDRDTEIVSQEVPALNATAIFSEVRETLDFMKLHLPQVPLSHCAITSMMHDINLYQAANAVAGSLYLTGESMFVHLHHGKETRFFNSFNYQTTGEMAYFMAAITRNLDIDPQTLALKVSGTVHNLPQHTIALTPFFPMATTAPIHPSLQTLLPVEQAHRFQLLANHLL
jgi:hypothetical protein